MGRVFSRHGERGKREEPCTDPEIKWKKETLCGPADDKHGGGAFRIPLSGLKHDEYRVVSPSDLWKRKKKEKRDRLNK